MSAQTAADLRAAADLLERDGWTQEFNERDGCRCTLGALAYAISDGATNSDGALYHLGGLERLRAAIGRLGFDHNILKVINWNDAPDRTADEVIASLRAAATDAEL